MEAQTILYFRPAEEQMHKKHSGQETLVGECFPDGKSFAGGNDGRIFVPVDCQVPAFYYKKKPWPGEVLLQAMETARNGCARTGGRISSSADNDTYVR